MANFSTANLVVAQTILQDRYGKAEMRMKPSPAFQLLAGNQDFLVADAKTLKTRDDRPIEAHLFTRTKRTPGTSRTHNHTGTLDDSQKVTLSWQTKTDTTAISLKLLDKSVFEFNEVLANKLEQCMMNIIEGYETATLSYLQAQRSQYSAALISAAFNATNDTVEIAAADKARFYQILKSVMRQNKHSAQLDVIADSLLFIDGEYQAAQGAGNSANTAFQFNGLNIVESIELADSNYTDGLALAMPSKSVCALTWIPKQNREGFGDYNSSVGGYGAIADPWGLGLTFALHGYAERADTSGTNGDKQDVLMNFEVSLDVSYNKSPLSGSDNESVIFQAGIV
jgi:hypothetical protein